MPENDDIIALVLAAGQSKRMKQSKITMAWGKETIISHIIATFRSAGIQKVLVVTGGHRELVEPEVIRAGAKVVFNPDYANDEMMISLHVGLNAIDREKLSGVFIALGDQPNIFTEDVKKIIDAHRVQPGKIIIPSHHMRRGHPWLIPDAYFDELLALFPPETLRSFLKKNEQGIRYVLVEHPEILLDMDTPQDYEQQKPK